MPKQLPQQKWQYQLVKTVGDQGQVAYGLHEVIYVDGVMARYRPTPRIRFTEKQIIDAKFSTPREFAALVLGDMLRDILTHPVVGAHEFQQPQQDPVGTPIPASPPPPKAVEAPPEEPTEPPAPDPSENGKVDEGE